MLFLLLLPLLHFAFFPPLSIIIIIIILFYSNLFFLFPCFISFFSAFFFFFLSFVIFLSFFFFLVHSLVFSITLFFIFLGIAFHLLFFSHCLLFYFSLPSFIKPLVILLPSSFQPTLFTSFHPLVTFFLSVFFIPLIQLIFTLSIPFFVFSTIMVLQ